MSYRTGTVDAKVLQIGVMRVRFPVDAVAFRSEKYLTSVVGTREDVSSEGSPM